MFEFLKECDENLYQEIIDEVEPNMVNKTCLPIIQSKFEKTLKLILKGSGINIQNDRPTIGDILNHNNFKRYLIDNDLMSENDITKFWGINNAANDVKHEGKIEITDGQKGEALLFLFDFCKNYYQFITNKAADAEFDIKYVECLIKGIKEEPVRPIINRGPVGPIKISIGNQEIIDALERLEEKYHRASGYKVREVLFEIGIEINADEERKMRGKLRKMYNGDIVYTPCGKGSGTYRLSKYRGK